jgi:hypothetical protein
MEIDQETLDVLAKSAGFSSFEELDRRTKAEKLAKLDAARKAEDERCQVEYLKALELKDKLILDHYPESFLVSIGGKRVLKAKSGMDSFVCPGCAEPLGEVRAMLHDLLSVCDPTTGRFEDLNLRMTMGRQGLLPVVIDAVKCPKCEEASRIVCQVLL